MASSCRVASEIVTIGRIPSRVLSVRSQPAHASRGGNSENANVSPRPVCYVVPGNPGAASFYRSFMQYLWEYSEGRMDIISVSHAGQDPGVLKRDVMTAEDDVTGASSKSSEHSCLIDSDYNNGYFTVADNVEHHCAALHQLTQPGQPVILMGHSMGSYLMIQMCRRAGIERRVVRVLHLLPCPGWMGSSPNGQRMSPVLTQLQWLIRGVHGVLTYLPHCLLRAIVRLHLSDVAPELLDECVEIVMHSVTGPGCDVMVANTAALAGNEVRVMLDFDLQALGVIQSRSTFICSPTDGWFPMHRVDELRTEMPELDVRIVDDIPHAFVLCKSKQVAGMSWDLIRENVGNQ